MRTTVEILDAIKRRLSIASDYKLAQAMGVSRQSVSQWRNGVYHLDVFASAKAAELLGEPHIKIIAIVEAERTKRPEQVKYWKELAKASMIATALIAGGVFGAPGTAHAAAQPIDSGTGYTLFDTDKRRRDRRKYPNYHETHAHA